MKYLVLRKRLDLDYNPFTQPVGAGDVDLSPFEATSEDLTDDQVHELRRDPNTHDVTLSIPFTLIEPVKAGKPSDKLETQVAWGIEAVGASSSPQNGAGVTVAVLDTGIDKDHEAFAGLFGNPNVLMDFTTDETGVAGSAPDQHGHGTHVAATIFGRAVNGIRIGVAPGITKVLIGKVLGPDGGSTTSVYNAIEWALNNGADVISMSLGIDLPTVVDTLVTEEGFPPGIAASRALEAYRSNVRIFDALAQSIRARFANGRGALVVAASGNESLRDKDPRFTVAVAPPAAADGFISVGALSLTKKGAKKAASGFAIASFSNTGCALAAPGVSILSAKRGGGLVESSGTSMATPHVTGVIALWIQKMYGGGSRPSGWAGNVQRSVESHVRHLPALDRKDVGLGLVQAPH
jgi:subtilisin family serine protease